MFISFSDYYSSLASSRFFAAAAELRLLWLSFCWYYIIKIFLICFHFGMLARLLQKSKRSHEKICCGCRRRCSRRLCRVKQKTRQT